MLITNEIVPRKQRVSESKSSKAVVNYLRSDNKALILMYHSVADVSADPWSLCVTPQHLGEQLEALRGYARPMHLRELAAALAAGRIPSRAVAVTFDDGYANNLHNARPLLERYGIPATVFIATGYLGSDREFWWDELERLLLEPGALPETLRLTVNGQPREWSLSESAQYTDELREQYRPWRAWEDAPSARHSLYVSLWEHLNPLPENERQSALNELRVWAGAVSKARSTHRPLTSEEATLLVKGEIVEAASHTVTHSALSGLAPDRQRDEIRRSKTVLEELIGRPVTSFAFPYGRACDYTAETVRLVREAGFTCACVAFEGVIDQRSDCYQLPRVPVIDWNGQEFERHLAWWFES